MPRLTTYRTLPDGNCLFNAYGIGLAATLKNGQLKQQVAYGSFKEFEQYLGDDLATFINKYSNLQELEASLAHALRAYCADLFRKNRAIGAQLLAPHLVMGFDNFLRGDNPLEYSNFTHSFFHTDCNEMYHAIVSQFPEGTAPEIMRSAFYNNIMGENGHSRAAWENYTNPTGQNLYNQYVNKIATETQFAGQQELMMLYTQFKIPTAMRHGEAVTTIPPEAHGDDCVIITDSHPGHHNVFLTEAQMTALNPAVTEDASALVEYKPSIELSTRLYTMFKERNFKENNLNNVVKMAEELIANVDTLVASDVNDEGEVLAVQLQKEEVRLFLEENPEYVMSSKRVLHA